MYPISSTQENCMYPFVIVVREVKFVAQHNCWTPGRMSISFVV